MPPIVKHLFQHSANGVLGSVGAQDEARSGSTRCRPTADGSACFIPSEARSDSSFQTRAFLDPFSVSSRLPLSMVVMGAAYSAYILIYP